MEDRTERRPLRVIIADDHTLFRQGIRLLLESEEGFEVVGEAADGRETVEATRRLRPDVVILDLTMPGMGGLEACRVITRDLPDVKVIVLTMHASDEYFFESLRAGASGYVLKEAAFSDLRLALEAASRGDVYLYPSLARRLVQDYLERSADQQDREALERLTAREREILELIAQGLTNQEIADRLYITVNTVQTHRSHIMEKLNLHSKAQLLQRAVRMGLVSRPPNSPAC